MKVPALIRHYALATWYGADRRPARLLPQAIRVLRARLAYGIGPIPYSLFGLAHLPPTNWRDYIIKKDDTDVVFNVFNPPGMHRLAGNKILFYEHCRRETLPTIPIVCRVGGVPDAFSGSVEHVLDPERLGVLLGAAPASLFAKSVDGSFGEGAFVIHGRGTRFEFAGRTGTASDLLAYASRQCSTKAGFIIQPQVRPHAKLLPLASPSGLPTIRVVTAMDEAAGPHVLYACIKIPVGANITDNFAHGAAGNLLAGIALDSGELAPAHGSRSRRWPVMTRVDCHPDSGCRITGSRIPFWGEIIDLAVRAQRSLPQFKTVGWDIAVTTNGVVLVEANSKYSTDILQVALQRGIKQDLGAKLHVRIA